RIEPQLPTSWIQLVISQKCSGQAAFVPPDTGHDPGAVRLPACRPQAAGVHHLPAAPVSSRLSQAQTPVPPAPSPDGAGYGHPMVPSSRASPTQAPTPPIHLVYAVGYAGRIAVRTSSEFS